MSFVSCIITNKVSEQRVVVEEKTEEQYWAEDEEWDKDYSISQRQ